MTDLYIIAGGQGAAHKSVKHRAVALSPDMRAAEALRLVLLEGLAHASANVPGVIEGANEKSLHQLRVALRRLDTVLRVFARVTGVKRVTELRRGIKAHLKATARARDLDVFLSMLPAIESESRDPLEMERFRAHTDGIRREAWRQASNTVASLSFATLLDDIAMLAESRAFETGKPAVQAMRKALRKTWKRCRIHGKDFSSHTARERHELRIQLKRLAYEGEIFAGLRPSSKAKRQRAQLGDLRDILGRQQDLAVARRSLASLSPDGRFDDAVRMVEAYCRRHRRQLERTARPLWRKFKKKTPFWA